MSRKTLLAIIASAELFLGAYFILAFFAWIAKQLLITSFGTGSIGPGKSSSFFPFVIAMWLALAGVSFLLYNRTKRKIKGLEPETPKETKPEEKHTTAA